MRREAAAFCRPGMETGMKLIKDEPRWIGWTIGLMILWEFVLMFDLDGVLRSTFVVWALEMIVFGRLLFCVSLKENRVLWIFWGAVLVIFLTSAIRPTEVLQWTRDHLRRSVLPYLLVPAVGLLLPEAELKKLLKVITAAWTVLVAALSIVTLYCVLHGIGMYHSRLHWCLDINNGSLMMLDGKNNSGINLTMSMMIAMVGCALYTKKWQKALFLAAVVPMFLTLPMTRCRTGYLGTAVGLGIAAVCALQGPLRGKIRRDWIRKGISVILAAGIGIGVLPVFSWSIPVVNRLIQEEVEEELVPGRREEAAETGSAGEEAAESPAADADGTEERAAAEAPKKAKTIKSRSFFKKDLLSGREEFWTSAAEVLKHRPFLLVTGTSLPLVMQYVGEYMDTGVHEHVHSMPLQILLETGVWGFALLLVFLFLLIRAAWKLFFSPEAEGWKRILVLPAAVIILIEMMECTTRLGKISPQIVFVNFFSALTLILAGRTGTKKEKNPK